MEITLKDGKSISVEQGAKPIDIASKLSNKLKKDSSRS